MQSILEKQISKLTGRKTSIATQGKYILLSLEDSGHLFIREDNLIKIPVYNTFGIADLELKIKIAKAIQSHITFKNIDERKGTF